VRETRDSTAWNTTNAVMRGSRSGLPFSNMVNFLGRFPERGDPNAEGAPSFPLYMTSSDTHLELSPARGPKAHDNQQNCDFWDQHRL
jgi:hypothetical protein